MGDYILRSRCIKMTKIRQNLDALKKMRQVDDTIINALNNSLPTESFSSQKDCTTVCKDLFNQLETNYSTREQAVNKCLEFSRKRVTELKEKKSRNENDTTVIKDLRKEQSKVRMLETELGVEEVIKARTKKVYYERCRAHYLPDNFHM